MGSRRFSSNEASAIHLSSILRAQERRREPQIRETILDIDRLIRNSNNQILMNPILNFDELLARPTAAVPAPSDHRYRPSTSSPLPFWHTPTPVICPASEGSSIAALSSLPSLCLPSPARLPHDSDCDRNPVERSAAAVLPTFSDGQRDQCTIRDTASVPCVDSNINNSINNGDNHGNHDYADGYETDIPPLYEQHLPNGTSPPAPAYNKADRRRGRKILFLAGARTWFFISLLVALAVGIGVLFVVFITLDAAKKRGRKGL